MNEQIPALQKQILEEEIKINAKIKDIEHEWKENRPKEASTRPEEASPTIKKATNELAILGRQIEDAISGLIRVCKAKELLDMELGDPDQLNHLRED